MWNSFQSFTILMKNCLWTCVRILIESIGVEVGFENDRFTVISIIKCDYSHHMNHMWWLRLKKSYFFVYIFQSCMTRVIRVLWYFWPYNGVFEMKMVYITHVVRGFWLFFTMRGWYEIHYMGHMWWGFFCFLLHVFYSIYATWVVGFFFF